MKMRNKFLLAGLLVFTALGVQALSLYAQTDLTAEKVAIESKTMTDRLNIDKSVVSTYNLVERMKPKGIYLGEFYVTAYCSCSKCCGVYASGRPVDENGNEIVVGASGVRLTSGYSIAVDTSVIPFGTKIIIDGQEYIAEDVGGTIKGNRIDVYCSTHSEAWNWATGYYDIYELVEPEL